LVGAWNGQEAVVRLTDPLGHGERSHSGVSGP
jgi:hypothetical protein